MESTENATEASLVGMLSPDGQWRWDGARWVPASVQQQRYSRDGRYVWTAAGWRPVRAPFWTPGNIVRSLVCAVLVIGIGIGVIDASQRQAEAERDLEKAFCRYDNDRPYCP